MNDRLEWYTNRQQARATELLAVRLYAPLPDYFELQLQDEAYTNRGYFGPWQSVQYSHWKHFKLWRYRD